MNTVSRQCFHGRQINVGACHAGLDEQGIVGDGTAVRRAGGDVEVKVVAI